MLLFISHGEQSDCKRRMNVNNMEVLVKEVNTCSGNKKNNEVQ